MNPATWRERLCISKAHLTGEDWALVAMDVSIGAPDSGPIILTMRAIERASERDALGLPRYMTALSIAAQKGWLAPLEWLRDGNIQTALRVPEGV